MQNWQIMQNVQNMQNMQICKMYKIYSTNYFPFPYIFLSLLRSSSHKSKCHEVQSPMSPFNLADLFSPRIWSSFSYFNNVDDENDYYWLRKEPKHKVTKFVYQGWVGRGHPLSNNEFCCRLRGRGGSPPPTR